MFKSQQIASSINILYNLQLIQVLQSLAQNLSCFYFQN